MIARDPDDLYDDAPVSRIEITCRRNGSLSVIGDILHLQYALAVLDHAKDAIRDMHRKNSNGIIVPAKDVVLPEKVDL